MISCIWSIWSCKDNRDSTEILEVINRMSWSCFFRWSQQRRKFRPSFFESTKTRCVPFGFSVESIICNRDFSFSIFCGINTRSKFYSKHSTTRHKVVQFHLENYLFYFYHHPPIALLWLCLKTSYRVCKFSSIESIYNYYACIMH